MRQIFYVANRFVKEKTDFFKFFYSTAKAKGHRRITEVNLWLKNPKHLATGLLYLVKVSLQPQLLLMVLKPQIVLLYHQDILGYITERKRLHSEAWKSQMGLLFFFLPTTRLHWLGHACVWEHVFVLQRPLRLVILVNRCYSITCSQHTHTHTPTHTHPYRHTNTQSARSAISRERCSKLGRWSQSTSWFVRLCVCSCVCLFKLT